MHVATGDCRIFAPIKKQNPKSVKGLILAYLVVYNNIVASNTIVSQWSLVELLALLDAQILQSPVIMRGRQILVCN